ncbi:hypothetical protein [Nocardia sp. CA-119907]|uniref:hypothetical protein n=1 Tax=Nocardia sp. CA-119907 TaxID=3239973 RepID=UPI003D9910D9
MPRTLALAESAHPEPGVRIRILLNARSFGETRHNPVIDYIQAYEYRDLSQTANADDALILERQFEMFNEQIESVHADTYYAAGNRSRSVDDVVAIEERF